jgi:hypothetical protein
VWGSPCPLHVTEVATKETAVNVAAFRPLSLARAAGACSYGSPLEKGPGALPGSPDSDTFLPDQLLYQRRPRPLRMRRRD